MLMFILQSGEPEVINYLLQTEFMPECLQSIVIGCDLSKTVESLLNRHRWIPLSRISLELGGNNKCVPVIVITFSAVQNCTCITKDIVNDAHCLAGRHLHTTEDFIRCPGLKLHLFYSRSIPRCGQHFGTTGY